MLNFGLFRSQERSPRPYRKRDGSTVKRFNGHAIQRWRNGGLLFSQQNSDIIRGYIWFRRVYGKKIPTYVERTHRGKERARFFMMKRFPKFFTARSLRDAGLTLNGKRRLRKYRGKTCYYCKKKTDAYSKHKDSPSSSVVVCCPSCHAIRHKFGVGGHDKTMLSKSLIKKGQRRLRK